MDPKNADKMANRVDPDQTAPLNWVYSVCLDLSIDLSENLGSL